MVQTALLHRDRHVTFHGRVDDQRETYDQSFLQRGTNWRRHLELADQRPSVTKQKEGKIKHCKKADEEIHRALTDQAYLRRHYSDPATDHRSDTWPTRFDVSRGC